MPENLKVDQNHYATVISKNTIATSTFGSLEKNTFWKWRATQTKGTKKILLFRINC